MEITSKPLALDELDRRILQLDMERLSLSKAAKKDRSAAARLTELDKELDGLRKRQFGLNAQWEGERDEMMKLSNIKEEVERVNLEVQQVRRGAIHRIVLSPCVIARHAVASLRVAQRDKTYNAARVRLGWYTRSFTP